MMFGYYLDLALRSLKRSRGLTVLMVLGIGFGVTLAMTTWSLVHMMSRDPIPSKSAQLFVPQIDMWGPGAHATETGAGDLPKQLDYADAVALMRDRRAWLQSAVYEVTPSLLPVDSRGHPVEVTGFAVYGQFFPMLDVPFRYGSGWGADEDAQRARVIVINSGVNDRLFGGGNSVGRTVNVDGHDYRVVGVLADWNPLPAYFDVPDNGGYLAGGIGLFVPFNTAIAADMPNQGNTDCHGESPAGFVALQRSRCVWISYLADIVGTRQAADYRHYLVDFARTRYSWPPHVRLRDLMGWLDYMQVVPASARVLRLVAFGLLAVCLVDTIALLLAKFLRRSGEIGVRRALGASRRAIYAQFLTEGAMIGVAGGALGLLLTWLALAWLATRMPRNFSVLASFDLHLLLLTLLVAVATTVLAALYPAYRAAHVQPGWQLKSN